MDEEFVSHLAKRADTFVLTKKATELYRLAKVHYESGDAKQGDEIFEHAEHFYSASKKAPTPNPHR